jgi:4-hydroxy-tetrahydrodipicolinate synthase
MHAAWNKGDIAGAMAINARLMPLHSAMFCETSPGPVKYAASLLGMGSEDMRLPMTAISDASKQSIKHIMQQLQLMS